MIEDPAVARRIDELLADAFLGRLFARGRGGHDVEGGGDVEAGCAGADDSRNWTSNRWSR